MCGVIGFIKQGATSEVAEGLKDLEYRGYDSAGLSYIKEGQIETVRSVGVVDRLIEKLTPDLVSTIAIGHTRWATHGGVTEANAHPHVSNDGTVSVVHNGIIENYLEIIEFLKIKGVHMNSQTDTEVIPNLIALNYHGDLMRAVKTATSMLEGSYALAIISTHEPDTIIATKRGRQPLIVGRAKGFSFVTSDMPATVSRADEYYVMEDDDLINVATAALPFVKNDKKGKEIVSRQNFTTFMEKEINEIPLVIERLQEEYKDRDIRAVVELLKYAGCVHISACGTAYHAGLIIGKFLEEVGVRSKVYIASEVRNSKPLLRGGDVAMVVSQSGETADTIDALLYFKEKGLKTIGICNIDGSTIARSVDYFLPTFAGFEIGVASTKAYVGQVLVGAWLSSQINFPGSLHYTTDMQKVDISRKLISLSSEIKAKAEQYKNIKRIFFLGKGYDYVTSLESALKVKEITYLHCEGFASGELKHGTLSLVDEETLCIIYGDSPKIRNAMHEVSARGAKVWMLPSEVSPALTIIPAQLFALYLSQEKGLDPDKPRNLAKSVTVE